MSLGSYLQWEEEDPFQYITSALESLGIAVIVSNGNNGQPYPQNQVWLHAYTPSQVFLLEFPLLQPLVRVSLLLDPLKTLYSPRFMVSRTPEVDP